MVKGETLKDGVSLHLIFEMRYEGMDMTKMYRLYNRCVYDIGVTLPNGQSPNIKPNAFILVNAYDILHIDSVCSKVKFISAKMLVPVDDNGNEMTLEQLGGYTDTSTPVHLSNNEISAMLKKSNKQIEAWLNDINDPAELHAIFEAVQQMDLPTSKMRILSAKMPNKDWLGSEEE